MQSNALTNPSTALWLSLIALSSKWVINRQSDATNTMLHPTMGNDAGKKSQSRKRYMRIDTLDVVLQVIAIVTSMPEREEA